MAETRNVFIKSKMDKDLDERLLPQGVYRDGRNISVSKSEGPDEGVVENILGNNLYSNFNFGQNVEIIGYYVDTNRDRIYIFATNYTDSSPTQLDAFAQGDIDGRGKTVNSTKCIIAYIEGPNQSNSFIPASEILVNGAFLNFSKTHPMLGVDLIEDLLFFTDNRNQPRKINVETAIANPATANPSTANPYYTNEDHISVSKFMPYEPIQLVYEDGGTIKSSMINETDEFLPANSISIVAGQGASTVTTNANLQIAIPASGPNYRFKNLNFPELGFFELTNISGGGSVITFKYPYGSSVAAGADSIAAANEAAISYKGDTGVPGIPDRLPFEPNDVLVFEMPNPDYNNAYQGDEKYLQNKFLRFSYRFKYDDNEFSLMAPFTQAAFVPEQYGYFIDSAYGPGGNPSTLKQDEKNTGESGVVSFMENQVTTIKMVIPFPLDINNNLKLREGTNQSLAKMLKVESIEILAKESDGIAIKIIDEIVLSEAFDPSSSNDFYLYEYFGNKPFKVLPDAASGRIHDKVPIRALAQAVSGNRVIYGNFIEKHGSPPNLQYELGVAEKPNLSSTAQVRKEYPNHTLKQNRSYKIGVVLVDRYGRSSNVILRADDDILLSGNASAIYAPYQNFSSPLNWPGNNLNITFTNVINPNKGTNYPGLQSPTNPTGYYSYKIVVQQQEQEYYNVFVPGACSGRITFFGKLGTSTVAGDKPLFPRGNEVTNIALFGDNINKVPKELADVGPTEEIYGSETLLYPRVVTQYLQVSSNYPDSYKPQTAYTQSSQAEGFHEYTVNSIISFNDLGAWTQQGNNNAIANSSYPHTATQYVDPLYRGASKNPFVAQIQTDFLIGYAPVVQEDSTSPDFSENLNVFETDPVLSKLDIYWETSSAGPILGSAANGGLNALIASGTAGVPVNISEPDLRLNESAGLNVDASDTFYAVDNQNNQLSGAQIEIDSVTYGDGVTAITNSFEIIELTAVPYTYKIQSTSYKYFGADRNLNTYNIRLKLISGINGAVNYVTKVLTLSNSKPSFGTIPDGYNSRPWLFEGQDGYTGPPLGSLVGDGSATAPFFLDVNNNYTLAVLRPGLAIFSGAQTTNIENGSNTSGAVNNEEVGLFVQGGWAGITQGTTQLPDGTIVNNGYTMTLREQTWWNAVYADGDVVLFKMFLKDAVDDPTFSGGIGLSQYYSCYMKILKT